MSGSKAPKPWDFVWPDDWDPDAAVKQPQPPKPRKAAKAPDPATARRPPVRSVAPAASNAGTFAQDVFEDWSGSSAPTAAVSATRQPPAAMESVSLPAVPAPGADSGKGRRRTDGKKPAVQAWEFVWPEDWDRDAALRGTGSASAGQQPQETATSGVPSARLPDEGGWMPSDIGQAGSGTPPALDAKAPGETGRPHAPATGDYTGADIGKARRAGKRQSPVRGIHEPGPEESQTPEPSKDARRHDGPPQAPDHQARTATRPGTAISELPEAAQGIIAGIGAGQGSPDHGQAAAAAVGTPLAAGTPSTGDIIHAREPEPHRNGAAHPEAPAVAPTGIRMVRPQADAHAGEESARLQGRIGRLEQRVAELSAVRTDLDRQLAAAQRKAGNEADLRERAEDRLREAAAKAAAAEDKCRSALQEAREARAVLAEEKKQRLTLSMRVNEAEARYGEERKAKEAAERQFREASERFEAERRRGQGSGPAWDTGNSGADPAPGTMNAATVFGRMGGAETSSDAADSNGGRKLPREVISVPPMKPGLRPRAVEVVRAEVPGRNGGPGQPRPAPDPSAEAAVTAVLQPGLDAVRPRMTLAATLSPYRTNPERMFEAAEQARASQFRSTEPRAAVSDDQRLQQARERVASDPLVVDVCRAVSLMGQMEGKPDVVQRVSDLLASVRRRLSGIEMKVMGAAANTVPALAG